MTGEGQAAKSEWWPSHGSRPWSGSGIMAMPEDVIIMVTKASL